MLRLACVLVALSFGTLANGQSCPPNGIGYLPHDTLCNSYYFCTTGAPNLRQCPMDLHWDQERRICAHPDSFVCTLRDLRCPEVTDPLDMVYLANSLDCTRYSLCLDGVALPQTCDEKYWDPVTEACVPPGQSSCVSTPTTPVPTTPVEVTCPSDTGLFYMAHPGRCEFYFVCSEGSLHFRTCAPGLVFDARNLWCDLEENSVCEGAEPPSTPTTITTTMGTTTITHSDTTTTPEPSTVDTTATPPPQPSPTTTRPDVNDLPPNICSGILAANVPHPNPIFCNYYIFCFLQSGTLRECRDGTIFSRTALECQPGDVHTCLLH